MRIGRYESSESSNVGTAITFLLIGLGAGALAGLLLAPKTGKQMRRDLQRGFDDAKDTLGDWADEAKDHVRDASDRVRDVASRASTWPTTCAKKSSPCAAPSTAAKKARRSDLGPQTSNRQRLTSEGQGADASFSQYK